MFTGSFFSGHTVDGNIVPHVQIHEKR